MNPELQCGPVCGCDCSERVRSHRSRVGTEKRLDTGAFEAREVGDKRGALLHWMIVQIVREMASAMRDRRLGWRIFDQVAGDQVVKVVGTQDRERVGGNSSFRTP